MELGRGTVGNSVSKTSRIGFNKWLKIACRFSFVCLVSYIYSLKVLLEDYDSSVAQWQCLLKTYVFDWIGEMELWVSSILLVRLNSRSTKGSRASNGKFVSSKCQEVGKQNREWEREKPKVEVATTRKHSINWSGLVLWSGPILHQELGTGLVLTGSKKLKSETKPIPTRIRQEPVE